MSSLFLILLATILLSSCNATQEQAQPHKIANESGGKFSFAYYTYGLPEPYYQRAEEAIFGRYGVSIQRVAGCEVSDSIINTVKAHNDSLFIALRKKYNGLTEDQLLQEMQQYVTTTKTIEATIQRSLKRKLALLNPRFFTFINWRADSEEGQYLVDFYANRYESK